MSKVRVYAGIDAAALVELRDGQAYLGPRVTAESDDEEHELDAMMTAVEDGPIVIVAEVSSSDAAVAFAEVEALHVDVDASGILAWFAPSEIDAVLAQISD